MALEDSVSLDISDALASIDRLGAGLTQSAQAFGVELASALDNLREPVAVTADASAVGPEVEAALAAADLQVEPTADASAVGPEVEAALAAADVEVEPTADASAVTAEIDAAALAADVLVEPTADSSAVTDSIDAAVDAADATIQPDASLITPAIEVAVAEADALVIADVDASAVTDGITEAIDSADSIVVVEPDVGGIQAEIEAAVDEADAVVVIEADVGQAQQSIAELGDTAKGASGGVGGLGQGVEGLGLLSAAAVGDVGNLTGGIGKFAAGHPVISGAVAGVGALAAATGVFVSHATDARESADTFRIAVGEFGDEVRNIDIGGLNQDLGDLAVSLGQDDEAAFNAASRIFQLGEAAGVARPEVAQTTKEILALGAQAIATNPSLGDLGAVAEGMVGALARGGRPAAAFGLALTAAEINARALKDTGKETAAELSIFEKSAAGAAIATERLGDSLGEKVQARVETAATGFARLRQEFDNTLEAAGQPMLDPLLEGLTEIQPALQDVATGLGDMLTQVVPLAVETAQGLLPAITASAESMGLLADTIGLVVAAGDGLLSFLPEGSDSLAEFGGATMAALNPLTPFVKGVEGLKGPWEDLFGGGVGASLVGEGADQIEASASAFAAAGENTGKWTRAQALAAIAANEAKDGTTDWEGALSDLQAGLLAGTEGADELTGAAEGTAGALGEAAANAEDAATAMTAMRTAMDALLGAFVGAEQAGLSYLRAQDQVESSAIEVFEAQVKLNEAVRDHGDKSKEAAGAAEELSDAQLGLREANLGAFTSANDLTVAMEKQTGALKGAGPEAKALRDQLVAMRDRFPELRQEIDKYVARIDAMAVPDLKMDEAVGAAKAAIGGLANILGPITDAQAREVGRVFGRGLADGLNSEADRLRVAGALAGTRVTQAARQSFGMRSPSRVGIEIGVNFAEAVARGIDDGNAAAVAAAERQAEAIAAAYSEQAVAAETIIGAFDTAAVSAVPARAVLVSAAPALAVPAMAQAAGSPLVTIAHADFSDPVDVDVFGQRLAFQMSVPR